MIRSFGSEPSLQEDKSGITIYMRGYFSFNYRRYRHAISPYTPAVLIELGRIANDLDRELLTTRPDFWADLVIGGLRDYFDDQEIEADWSAVAGAPYEALVSSLAMSCPFEAGEKQALLECKNHEDRAQMLISLFEINSEGGPSQGAVKH